MRVYQVRCSYIKEQAALKSQEGNKNDNII